MNHLTSEMQTAYKKGRSALDVLALVNNHMSNDDNASLILIDLTKAFDRINRTVLWTTTYESGLPIRFINDIRNGHQGNTLRPKVKGELGKKVGNNIGVFQGSPLSALLFIIYAERIMTDYNESLPLPIKKNCKGMIVRNYEEEKKWTDFAVRVRYRELNEKAPKGDPNENNTMTMKCDYHTYADDTTIKCRNDNEIAPKLTCYANSAEKFFFRYTMGQNELNSEEEYRKDKNYKRTTPRSPE